MSLEALQVAWFVLFFVLIAGYAILDGFDLGAGVLSLLNRSDAERRLYINAVAPVWDGNEVWLVTGGGALFAAFPPVYATVFSGFYLALMLVLLGLILRAVSMEFRGKVDSPAWRAVWDKAFGFGSLLPALLFGVAVGNLMRGLPLQSVTDAAGTRAEYAGGFVDLLNPFALLVGLLGLAMIVTQGALWLVLKTEGGLRARLLRSARIAWIVWGVLFVVASAASFADAPALHMGKLANPLLHVLLAVFVAAFVAIPLLRRPGLAFLASSTAIAAQVALAAAALFPNLVPARNEPSMSLTIWNASSTQGTLWTMLIIAAIGMPAVVAYTVVIYRVFRGKVVIDEQSY